MKKILFVIAVILGVGFLADNSYAGPQVVETVNSTATVQGVSVSTSAATRVDTIWVSGKNRAWIRIQNQDSTANVYCGFSTAVTGTAGVDLGEKLAPLGNAVYNVGRDIKLYCKSDGAASTYVSVAQFGY